MNSKEFRYRLAEDFLKSVNEDLGNWKRQWKITKQINAVTDKTYRGVNQFYLSMLGNVKGYEDNRWCTFKQARAKGWSVEAGAKGVPVEYSYLYNFETKEKLMWSEYKKLDDELKKNFKIINKISYVFNAKDIKGIPERKIEDSKQRVTVSDAVEKISKNMGVEVFNDGGNKAYYSPLRDNIHLPKMEHFDDDVAYNSTLLHELGHATGHSSRLNRTFGSFGDDLYAYEELVAELGSCFVSEEIELKESDFHKENHMEYLKNWARQIKLNPETLVRAIRDAEKCSEYMITSLDHAVSVNKEIKNDSVITSDNNLYKESDYTKFGVDLFCEKLREYDYSKKISLDELPAELLKNELERGYVFKDKKSSLAYINDNVRLKYKLLEKEDWNKDVKKIGITPEENPEQFSLYMLMEQFNIQTWLMGDDWDSDVTEYLTKEMADKYLEDETGIGLEKTKPKTKKKAIVKDIEV